MVMSIFFRRARRAVIMNRLWLINNGNLKRKIIKIVDYQMKKIISVFILGFACCALAQENYTEYYENGAKRVIGTKNDGVKVGRWDHYYPGGQISAKLSYRAGELDGNQFYYAANDRIIIAREHWEMGLLQDSSSYYYPDGQLEKKGVYKQGLYEGEWVFYYGNGYLKRIGSYQEGLPEGSWEFYHESGAINQKGKLRKGKEEGMWTYYDEEGNLQYEGAWEKGEKIGQWFFYKNGKKRKWKVF